MTEEISTCGAVIFDEKENVLLVEHLPGAHHITGKFGLPAGHIEEGESALEAVIREVFEETGIRLEPGTLKRLPMIYHAEIEQKDRIYNMKWEVYATQIANCILKESIETKPQWVKRIKIKHLNLLPNVLKAIREAEKLEV